MGGPWMLAAAPLAAWLVGPAMAQAPPPGDPTHGEVSLPCADGWQAALVIDDGSTGIWTVESFPVFPQYACPEVVGLDDRGRCLILVSYSGKWTPIPTIEERKWLGGLAHGDVDPRIPGAELYTGGQRGNLYQVVAYPHGAVDHRLIARFPGREIHTLAAGNLDPRTAESEILVFTRPGGLFRVSPTGPDGTFETTHLEDLPGRVRDAIVLAEGDEPEIAAVSRAGRLRLLRMTEEGPRWSTIHGAAMGMGRLALRSRAPGRATVLYTTLDDGRILRHERRGPDEWTTAAIYLGPQGPRGLAAGPFYADPEVESLAVFGYSGKVQLLSRRGAGAWEVETIFEDRDKGHWLATAELDGRNGTREILGSGYGGRVFLLRRPPGYGREGVATPPQAEQVRSRPPGPVRIAVRAGRAAVDGLSPLSYHGGFETKTLVYETLVRRDAQGRIAPGLARSWRFEDGDRTLVLELRQDARFHDGRPVDAAAVALHFRRWIGLPEHAWLRSAAHVRSIDATGPRELRIELDRPMALLPELCAINPCAIQGPGTLDGDGDFVRPVGSGPFRFVEAQDAGRRIRYELAGEAGVGPGEIELVRFGSDGARDPLQALLSGRIDVLVDGWAERIPRPALAELISSPDFVVDGVPGSSVTFLSFRLAGGPTAQRALRRAVRAAVDRWELVRVVEGGYGAPCSSWAVPSVEIWPRGRIPEAGGDVPPLDVPLTILVHREKRSELAVGALLVEQLRRCGLPAEVHGADADDYARALEHGAYDLRVERTWGVPYDPYISLTARFLPAPEEPTATRDRFHGVAPELASLVERATRMPRESERREVYRRIQEGMDREAWIVPLYAARRMAVRHADAPRLRLDHDLYRIGFESSDG